MKKGWQIKTIGDVCDLATGGTPSRTKPQYFGGDIKWLVSGDINQREIFDCLGRITAAGMKNSNARFLPINSVMIALNGQGKTRGTVALLRTLATCNQSMVSISPKPSSDLLPEFLYANLHGRYEEIRRLTSDDDKDRRGLNMGLIRSIRIPIAPLPEQQRIVALLDEAFADLATAKANAERNLLNARALFESHLNAVFTQRGPGWVDRKLGEICIVDWGNTDLTKKSYVEGGAFLAVSAAGCDGRIGHKEHPKHTPVLSAIGAQCGRMFLPEEDFTAIKNTITLTPRGGACTGRFLYRLLTHVDLPKRGAAQPFIAKGDIQAFSVSIPESLLVQDKIEESLTGLQIKTQRLTHLYEQKLAALEALKKSLLHQAFSGEL